MTEDMHRQLHRTKIFGLKGGENYPFKVARLQVQRGIGRGLPAIIFPDLLHTFLKGMIEASNVLVVGHFKLFGAYPNLMRIFKQPWERWKGQ